jgi:NitT/TauT family transport system ATP-binding protein
VEWTFSLANGAAAAFSPAPFTRMNRSESMAGQPSAPPLRITIDRVSKWFSSARGRTHALDDVSLEIADGEFVCLVGKSGCGKSTLLNMIAGLDMPDRGAVHAGGRMVTGPGRERMMMFQEPALFPWLDVMGNVLFGLKLSRDLSASERHGRAEYYLRLVGLGGFMHASLHELSGGMRQRVALARALAPNPRVLLMDEPFAALDAMTREQLYGDIQQICGTHRKTVVFVTHNVREAACLGDRVVLLSPHPGRICGALPIDLPRPRDINNPALAEYATLITQRLKTAGTAPAEFDI